MSLLEVQAVSKAFGGIHALNTCSLSVEEGSITGLIGPNGSGKLPSLMSLPVMKRWIPEPFDLAVAPSPMRNQTKYSG